MAKYTITHPDRELDLTVETDSGPASASAMVAKGVAALLGRPEDEVRAELVAIRIS